MRGRETLLAVLLALAATTASAQELVVSAAASLTNAFRGIGRDFEVAHPGAKVVLNFAASDVLLAQIANGAPADVFASADEAAMNRAEKGNLLAPAPGVTLPRTSSSSSCRDRRPPSRRCLRLPSRVSGVSPSAARRRCRPVATPGKRWSMPSSGRRWRPDWCSRRTCGRRWTTSRARKRTPDSSTRRTPRSCRTRSRSRSTWRRERRCGIRLPSIQGSRQPALAAAFVAYVGGAAGQQTLARFGFRAP